ncbi:MAG: hypothetical protein ACTHMD_10200 [Flavisolibacter sp.]
MKKYLLGFIAVIFAVAAISFKAVKHEKPTTFYYEYLGSTKTLSDYQEPGNWKGPIAQGSAGCTSNNLPCEVMSTIGNKTSFVNSITSTSVVDNNVSTRKP